MTSTATQQQPPGDPDPETPPETGQCIACLATIPLADLEPVPGTPELGCKDYKACTDRIQRRDAWRITSKAPQ